MTPKPDRRRCAAPPVVPSPSEYLGVNSAEGPVIQRQTPSAPCPFPHSCHPERSEGSLGRRKDPSPKARDDKRASARRHFINKPHHALQPPLRIERAEIDTFHDRRPRLGPERPRKPRAAV